MADREVLKAIRERDPDGWQHREPTAQDYAAFDKWVIENYGRKVWQEYSSNWDEEGNE